MSSVVGSGDVVLCTIPTDTGYALFLASGASERVCHRTVEPCVDVPRASDCCGNSAVVNWCPWHAFDNAQ